MSGRVRNPFTQEEDELLALYIAKYNPQRSRRQGNNLYRILVANAENHWSWASTHTWQSWRERYKKNRDMFDRKIKKILALKASAAVDHEFIPSVKAEEVSSKKKRQSHKPARKLSNSPTNDTTNKTKGNRVVRTENADHDAGGSRQILPVQGVTKKAISKPDHDKKQRTSKSSKPSENLAAPNAATSLKTSTVAAIEAPIEKHDDVMHELFGSDIEDSREQSMEIIPDSRDEEIVPCSLIQAAYRDLGIGTPVMVKPRRSPRASTPQHLFHAATPMPATPPTIAGPVQPTPAVHSIVPKPLLKMLKPKLRNPAREDPFGTPSESSAPLQPRYGPTRTVALPVLVDDGFRMTLKRPHPSSGRDVDTPQWPPKRAKMNAEISDSKVLYMEADRMEVDAAAPAEGRKRKIHHKHVHLSRVHVNVVASSSKTKLPSAATTTKQRNTASPPNNLHPKVVPVETSRNIIAPKITPTEAAATPKTASAAPSKKLIPVARTSSSHALPASALSDNDPFMAKTVLEIQKGQSRANFMIKDNHPPRIDLHKQSLQRRLSNTSLPIPANHSHYNSHTSSSSGMNSKQLLGGEEDSWHKSLIGIGPADPNFELAVAAVEEVTQMLAQMAATYGLGERIANEIYVKTRNLEKTKFMLQQLHVAMTEKEMVLYTAMPELVWKSNRDAESDDEIPAGLVPSNPPRSGGRASLSMTIWPDFDEEDHSLSEYVPPMKSRAGKFARLMKQGRINEALERERLCVAGFFVPETQVPRQSPPLPDAVSPTPQPHNISMEVDTDGERVIDGMENNAAIAPEDEEDDIYVRDKMDCKAADKSDHQNGKKAILSSPSYSATQVLIKHLSDGRDRGSEFLAQAQRHKELALAVTVQHDKELRQFEKEHSKGMLRLWSVEWVQEILKSDR